MILECANFDKLQNLGWKPLNFLRIVLVKFTNGMLQILTGFYDINEVIRNRDKRF